MSVHVAVTRWTRDGAVFTDGQYSRAHVIGFDGGVELAGSSAPEVVPPPRSKVDAADPEEMLVAAVASCHMLFFLDFARRKGFIVDSYVCDTEGRLGKDDDGVARMLEIVMRPRIAWSGEVVPDAADVELLHHKSHQACYIANSLKCPVRVDAS